MTVYKTAVNIKESESELESDTQKVKESESYVLGTDFKVLYETLTESNCQNQQLWAYFHISLEMLGTMIFHEFIQFDWLGGKSSIRIKVAKQHKT